MFNALDRLGHIGHIEQDIVTGLQGLPLQFPGRVTLARSFHVQRIAKNHALITPLTAKKPLQGCRIQTHRQVQPTIQGVHDQMSRHHGWQSQKASKGAELQAIQLLPALVQDRQIMVRVQFGIPVSRKMLGTRHNAGLLQTPRIGQSHREDIAGFRPKGTKPNHRVKRIAIHIGHRAKTDMHSQFLQFPPHRLGQSFDQVRVLASPHRHGIRETRPIVQTHRRPPFGIHRHP